MENDPTPSQREGIHLTHLKVLADLLHHLQLRFVGWKLKDRVLPLIKPPEGYGSPSSGLCLRAQQGRSDLISFTFTVQVNQKVHGENTLRHAHTNTHAHRHTRTFDWTKAHRSHHIAHAEHWGSVFNLLHILP